MTTLDKASLDAAFEAYWGAEGGTFKGIEAAIVAYLDARPSARLSSVDPTKPHMHAAGTLIGKHIDECSICGQDLRCEIHRSPR